MKKLIMFLLIGMFLISFASAWTSSEFTRDEIKSLDKLTNFGTYEIKESAWYDPLKIWTEETIKTINLESNTDSCGQNCKAQMRFNLLKDGVLIEDSKFLDVDNKMKETTIRSSSVWIWDNPKTGTESYLDNVCSYTEEGEEESCSNVLKERSYYYKLVDDYEYVCEETDELSKNGTAIEECRNEVVGQKEYRYDGWVRYNTGDEVVAGEYLVELRGNKPFDKEIDWQIKVNGIWTSAWAIWGFTDMTEGLVAQYRANTQDFSVDNQTIVKDTLGLNNGTLSGKTFNDGTVSGGVTIEDGAMKFGESVKGSVTTGAINTIVTTLNDKTISMWVKINQTSVMGTDPFPNLVRITNGTAKNEISFFIYVNSSSANYGKVTFKIYNQTTSSERNSISIMDNSWHYLTGLVNSTNVCLYLDGTLSGCNSNTIGSTLSISPSTTIRIGNNINGSIDDTLIFNRALSQDEITQLYNQGRGQYSSVTNGLVAQYSGRDFAGTEASPTTIYDTNHLGDGKVLESLSFDGVDDYVDTPTITFNNSNNLSIGGWIKINKNSTEMALISQRQGANNQLELSVLNDNTVRFRVSNGTAYNQAISINKVYADDNWHYVFGNYNGTHINLFVDNIYSSPTSFMGVILVTGNSQIGSRIANAIPFNGSLDDVRIYNRSLTEDEIAYLYNSGMGREDSSDAWIEVNSPFDNQVIYTNQVTTNATAYVESGAYLTNASLNLSVNGGAWGIRNTSLIGGNVLNSTGLKNYYSFDETSGTTLTDLKAGNNGANSGITLNQEGIINLSYLFAGGSSSISTLTSEITQTDTFNIWLYRTGTEAEQHIAVANSLTEGFSGYREGGYIGVYYSNTHSMSSVTTDLNAWNMITFVWDSNGYKLYKNGIYQEKILVGGKIPIKTFSRTANSAGWQGRMDEVGIWNRSLSDPEISNLYNSNLAGFRLFGDTTTQTVLFTNTFNAGDVVDFNYLFGDSDGDVGKSETRRFSIDSTAPTIEASLNDTILYAWGNNMTVNYNITDVNLDFCYYIYAGKPPSYMNCSGESFNFTTKENYTSITLHAVDQANNRESKTLNFSLDSSAPTIALNYPTALIDYGKLNGTLQLNFTATDTNLDSVWYNYNGTNVTIAGAVSGVYNQSNITLSTKKNVTIYANDTAGNLKAEVFGWDYKVFENSMTYVNQTYSKVSNVFTLNMTSVNATGAKLNYNGNNYTANMFQSGLNKIATISVTSPLIDNDTNITFYWIVSLSSEDIKLEEKNQTIRYVVVGNTYSQLIYNITVRNEETNAIIPNNNVTVSYEVTYGFDINSILGTINFNDNKLANKNISSNIFTNLYLSGDIIYSSDLYIGRTLQFLENNISSAKNLTLYLSYSNSSFVKSILVTDEAGRNKPALFKQYRNINGIKTLVASEQLDGSGKSTIAFTPNVQYTFEFENTGCQNLTKNIIFYDQSDYVQVLSCSAYNPDDYLDPFENMRASFAPDGVFYVNNETEDDDSAFSVNVSGNSAFCNNVNVISFSVFDELGNLIINDNSNDCDVLGGSGFFDLYAVGNLYILLDSGEEKKLSYRWIKIYSDASYSDYNIIELLKEVGNSDDILGIDWKFKLLISFIGLFGIIIAMTLYQRIYNFSNLPILIVANVYIWFMCFIGWGNIGIAVTGGGITAQISKYGLLILSIIGTVGVIANKEDEYS